MSQLDELIKERDEYLKRNPKMQEFQNQIDELLEKTPSEKRLEVIILMMSGKLIELQCALMELSRVINISK